MSIAEIKKLFLKQQKLVDDLFNIDRMLKGSYCVGHTKCGKQNCWCAEGVGHPYGRLSWREAGKSRIRSVPEEDIKWVKQMTRNYNLFKQLSEDLADTHLQIKILLNNHLEKVVTATKKEKDYLKI